MQSNYLHFVHNLSAGRLVEALQRRQHVNPHQSVLASLARVGHDLGISPGAAARAVQALHIDPQRSVGRLRSTEISQLALTVDRLMRQNLRPAAV